RRMQHAPPENPDPLALDVEEVDGFEPGTLRLRRDPDEPRRRKLRQPRNIVLNRGFGRQNIAGWRLFLSKELAEKAPARQQLMLDDLPDRSRARMRTPVEILIAKTSPHRGDFVDFARIGVHRVLESRASRARNPAIADLAPAVLHYFFSWSPATRFAK